MRYLILLIIAFEAQLLFADNRTDFIQVVRDIEQFMTLETANLKVITESTFAEKKQKLNEAVDILEQFIKQGPEKCHDYLTDVNKIRKFYINFRYSFYDCKLHSSMDVNKKKFAKLLKEFDDWKKKCYEPMDEECLRKFEMFDKRFGNFFTDFRNAVYGQKLQTYLCLNKLKKLVCAKIMEAWESLWSNKCTNTNNSLINMELISKCSIYSDTPPYYFNSFHNVAPISNCSYLKKLYPIKIN